MTPEGRVKEVANIKRYKKTLEVRKACAIWEAAANLEADVRQEEEVLVDILFQKGSPDLLLMLCSKEECS